MKYIVAVVAAVAEAGIVVVAAGIAAEVAASGAYAEHSAESVVQVSEHEQEASEVH